MLSSLESPCKASILNKNTVDNVVCLEAACANEVSLIILDILDIFAQKFGVSGNSVLLLPFYAWYTISIHNVLPTNQ